MEGLECFFGLTFLFVLFLVLPSGFTIPICVSRDANRRIQKEDHTRRAHEVTSYAVRIEPRAAATRRGVSILAASKPTVLLKYGTGP